MSENSKDVELPLESVAGTDDQFVATLPDGNRVVLTGQMPHDGGESTFEVRRDARIQPGASVHEISHMPGCGLNGPFIEGQHQGCALCGAAFQLCGNSAAPYEGRCCDRCAQKRVLPRRVEIMTLLGKLSAATVTPFAALAARDAVMSELFRPEALQALKMDDLRDMSIMKSIRGG